MTHSVAGDGTCQNVELVHEVPEATGPQRGDVVIYFGHDGRVRNALVTASAQDIAERSYDDEDSDGSPLADIVPGVLDLVIASKSNRWNRTYTRSAVPPANAESHNSYGWRLPETVPAS